MDLFGDFSIGPFSLPFRFILGGGILAAAILLARIPLRRHRLLRSRVTERLINAVVIFAVAWKLTPVVIHPAVLLRDPLPLFMAAPGVIGLGAGLAAGAVYLMISLLKRRGLRQAAILPLALFAAVTAVGISAVQIASSVTILSNRPPGPAAPALSLPTLDNRGVSLEALRGRVVVVNFWATWCPPCRAELPDLAAFARNQRTNAMLVGVNATFSERSERAVRLFAEEHEVGFTVALDRAGDVTRAWGVQVWPTTVVVDPDGRVFARRTGAVEIGWLRREVRSAGKRNKPGT